MFEVVELDFTETGCYSSATLFRALAERDCWNFVRRRLLHPKKCVRENAKRLYVKNPSGTIWNMPYNVKVLHGL